MLIYVKIAPTVTDLDKTLNKLFFAGCRQTKSNFIDSSWETTPVSFGRAWKSSMVINALLRHRIAFDQVIVVP